MIDRPDSDAYLAAVRDARLAVLHTAKLIDDPALFSVRSLFAAYRAEAELILRGAA
jgi:hypothetical protein